MMNKTTNKLSPEVRARAVRMVLEHEGDHRLDRSQDRLHGRDPSALAEESGAGQRQRENRELRQANEILRKA